MSELAELRRTSVTRDDALERPDAGGIGGVWQWTVIDPSGASAKVGLPAWGDMRRDVLLRSTGFLSDLWGGALRTAMNQVLVRSFIVKDSADSDRRTERAQSLLLDLGGPAGYTDEMSKVAQDYLTTDNGAFLEVARESKDPRSRPVALFHLDSLRCWRTGSPEYPVVYVDYWGRYHRLHANNVINLVDNPWPGLGAWGRGVCAASGCWQTITANAALELYFQEKISGGQALALHFVRGVSTQQMSDAAASAEEERARKGWLVYKGAIVVPTLEEAQVATIDLARIPEGWTAEEVARRHAMVFSLHLGIPVTDIITLAGGQFGTGTQSQVIDESRKGRGVEALVKLFERKINRLIMPKTTTVDMFGIDVRDQKAEADVKVAEATYAKTLIDAGIASTQQAGNYLADLGCWPQEFIAADATPGAALADSGEQSKVAEAQPGALPPPAQPPQATKAALVARLPRLPTPRDEADDEAARLLEATVQEAITLAEKVLR